MKVFHLAVLPFLARPILIFFFKFICLLLLAVFIKFWGVYANFQNSSHRFTGDTDVSYRAISTSFLVKIVSVRFSFFSFFMIFLYGSIFLFTITFLCLL